MSWDQLLEPGVTVRDSPVETDRFGCTIARVTIGPGPVDADHLLAVIRDLSSAVLVVRYDAARLDLPSTFARSRRAVVPAGTLTYWERSVSVADPRHLRTSRCSLRTPWTSRPFPHWSGRSFGLLSWTTGTITRQIRFWTVPQHWQGTRTGRSDH